MTVVVIFVTQRGAVRRRCYRRCAPRCFQVTGTIADHDGPYQVYDPAVVRRALEGLRPFGNGGFGMVYRATIGGEQLAVKAFRRDTVNGIDRQAFHNEVDILGLVRHNNIVRIRGMAVDVDDLWIMFDWMQAGDLAASLAQNSPLQLTNRERIKVCRDVANALLFCHNRCDGRLPRMLLHRDVKPQNILLSVERQEGQGSSGPGRTITALLADFGISKLYGDGDTHTGAPFGTFGYIAPEVNDVGQVTAAADVYSFGVTVLQVATGLDTRVPVDGIAATNFVHIASKDLEWLVGHSTVQWASPTQHRALVAIGLACTLRLPERMQLAVALEQLRRASAGLQVDTRVQVLAAAPQVAAPPQAGPHAHPGPIAIDNEERRECRVCMLRPRNTRITTCRHMTMCEECTQFMLRNGAARCFLCGHPFTAADLVRGVPGEATFQPEEVFHVRL